MVSTGRRWLLWHLPLWTTLHLPLAFLIGAYCASARVDCLRIPTSRVSLGPIDGPCVSPQGRLVVFWLCLLGFHSASARMSSVDAELVAALVQRVVALEQRVAELEQHVGVPQASRRARRPPLFWALPRVTLGPILPALRLHFGGRLVGCGRCACP